MAKMIFSIVGLIILIIATMYYIKGLKSKRIIDNRKRIWLTIVQGLLVITMLIMWIFNQIIIAMALFLLNFIIELILLAANDDSPLGGIYRSGGIVVIERIDDAEPRKDEGDGGKTDD